MTLNNYDDVILYRYKQLKKKIKCVNSVKKYVEYLQITRSI